MSIAPGTRFGPYEIAEQIGHGGMGIVYRARDARLNRDVALKLVAEGYLHSETPTLASHERFLREARASSALNHPNICTIYDVGEQDGRPYLVMELLHGQTLRQTIRGHAMPIEQILLYGSQLAAALAEAHAHGILHRDIKPANLFIAPKSHGTPQLKVLDFGLAKQSAANGDAAQTSASLGAAHTSAVNREAEESLTTTGSAVGTIAYMSPEQARGEPLDARSDIFSAGAVLYEMASGRSPFAAASAAETFAALLTRNPEPLRKYNPTAPKELERILAKALARDKAARYQTAGALLRDLQELQQRYSARTRRIAPMHDATTLPYLVARDPGKRPSRGAMVAALVLLAVCFAGVAGFYWWRTHRPPTITEKDPIILSDFTNRTGDAVFDYTLRQALAVQLSQSPLLNILSEQHLRNSLQYLGKSPDTEITPAIARDIGEREGAKAIIAGSIANLGSQYVLTLEAQNITTGDTFAREQAQAKDKEHVLEALDGAAERMRSRLGESLASIRNLNAPFGQATTPSLEAFRAYALGEAEHIQSHEAQAIGSYQRAIELDPNFAMAYARLGATYFSIGSVRQAVENTTRAFQLSDKVTERERLYIRSRYYSDVTGDIPKAIQTLELYGQTYPSDGIVPNNLSVAYLAIGDYERAYAQAERAMEMEPNRGSPYVNALAALLGLNRPGDAKEVFENATVHKVADDGSLRGNWLLANYLVGDTAEMERQKQWSQGKPDGYIIAYQLAQFGDVEGRFEGSMANWRQAMSAVREQGQKDTEANYLMTMSVDRALAGNCNGAVTWVDQALGLDQERATLYGAALTLALCGEPARADSIEHDMLRRFPEDTLVNSVYAPSIMAVEAIGTNRPNEALTALSPADRYDNAGLSAYLRGLAHLALKDGRSASNDFLFITTHKGTFLSGGTLGMAVAYPMAQLGLARAYAMSGDRVKARQVYQEFLITWKNADPDDPNLLNARREAGAL